MIFDNFDRIVFAGDSVTDMGSAQPVGEGLFDNMGRGFPRVIENMIYATYPELTLRFTNSGISGNTSRDLLARYERDVLDLNPQWVSICIGINDVWRQFDTPGMLNYAVSPEDYEKNMREMIESAQKVAKGVIVTTPYYMEPNKADFMRARMQDYVDICARLAEEYNCIFVNFQEIVVFFGQIIELIEIRCEETADGKLFLLVIRKLGKSRHTFYGDVGGVFVDGVFHVRSRGDLDGVDNEHRHC